MSERKLLTLRELKDTIRKDTGSKPKEMDRDWFKQQFPDTLLTVGFAPEIITEGFKVEVQDESKAFVDPDLQIKFVISNETLDRDNDTIAVAGWDLKNYSKNPVVLWAHDQRQPPIARSVRTAKEDESLVSITQFPPKDLQPFGHMVFGLYQAGFMRAVSVGFDPTRWVMVDEEGRGFGFDFMEQELLEFSAVPVPSNPDALSLARSKGIDTAPMKEWAERVLDEATNGILATGLPMSKMYVEELARSSDPKQKIVVPFSTGLPDEEVGAHKAIGYDEAHPEQPPVADKRTPFDRDAENAFVPDKSGSMGAYLGDSFTTEIALLHHHAAGGAVNWSGVRSAMEHVLGKRIDGDLSLVGIVGESVAIGCYEHLCRHYRQDFDTEPPSATHVRSQTLRDYADAMCLDLDTGLVRTKTDQEIHREQLDATLGFAIAAIHNLGKATQKVGSEVAKAIEPIVEAMKQIDEMGIDQYVEALEDSETCNQDSDGAMLSDGTPTKGDSFEDCFGEALAQSVTEVTGVLSG